MADKKTEPKLVLEREYIIPLRKEWLKVPKYKRANKATKAIKEFLVKHMKIYDRDLRKIKIDQLLNNEIRFRGMRKPLAKVEIKAKKYDNDIVRVELLNLPPVVAFKKAKAEKTSNAVKEKVKTEAKPAPEDKEVKKEEEQKKEEAKDKEEASRDEGLKISKDQAKEQKHISKEKNPIIQRKTLSR